MSLNKKICIINPNTTTSMTEVIDNAAKKYAGLDTEIISTQPKLVLKVLKVIMMKLFVFLLSLIHI